MKNMKKVALLLSLAVSAFAANAQVTLTGTSYTQNFDGIGTSLPTGWTVQSGSSATSLGAAATWYTSTEFPSFLGSDTTCNSFVLSGGFKNFPSADVSSPGDDYCATPPPSYTNRAIGVRQVSPTNATHPNLDSGAAFVLEVANTTGFTNFKLNYQLQSLDTSSPRVTKWKVDYSIGTPTNFIPVTTTTGIFTTGGNTFSNNHDSVSFGSALDNISQPIWIRIVTLDYSSGSGNRASTAVDDYKLSWTSSTSAVQNVSAQSATSLTVLGAATSDKVTMAYSVEEAGQYTLSFYDLTGRAIHTENIDAQTGSQTITLSGLHLVPGMFIAKMYNSNSSSVAKISVQ